MIKVMSDFVKKAMEGEKYKKDSALPAFSEAPPYVAYYWGLPKSSYETVLLKGEEKIEARIYLILSDEKEVFPELSRANSIIIWQSKGKTFHDLLSASVVGQFYVGLEKAKL